MAHDAEHHEASQARHALEQKIHVLDVAAADVMLGRADAQEQQRLRDGMEQDEETRPPTQLRACRRQRRPMMRPKLAMVEYASTRLALLCEMAMNEHSANVRPPTSTTMADAHGEHQEQRARASPAGSTPAFTMVEECRSALVGVGATIAPRSHVWNGICAAFVMPANASSGHGQDEHAGRGGVGDGRRSQAVSKDTLNRRDSP